MHRFTETLPRQHTASGECDECERDLQPHEGPPTPRRFDYAAREIARALVAVGSGTTFRRAGLDVRVRADRLRYTRHGRLKRNDDGNTVADWVEVFSPVIFEHYRPREWPRVVALDALPFAVTDYNAQGHSKQGGKPAFHVFAAYGWGAGVISLRAQPGFKFRQGVPYWANFLEDLRADLGGGMPEQMICDPDDDIWRAIELVWPPTRGPSPIVYVCHWHLRHRLLEILRQAGLHATDPLYEAASHAFDWKQRWDSFIQLAAPVPNQQLRNWVKRWRARVEFQLTRQAGRQVSVGPLEQALTVIRNNFEDRRGNFKNRERLNRLLMLMQLDLNKQVDERRYARLIRHQLITHGGHAPLRRRIVDPRGSKHSLAA